MSAACLVVSFAGRPPLGQHGFWQTQTPVAGYPQAIPLECSFYQVIIAGPSHMFGVSVSVAGRLVSFCFLLRCIPVDASINRRLSFTSPR